MLDRQHGHFIFECDTCGDTLETEARDFTTARETMTKEGWKARKIGVDWCHSCPDCGVPGERAPLAKSARN